MVSYNSCQKREPKSISRISNEWIDLPATKNENRKKITRRRRRSSLIPTGVMFIINQIVIYFWAIHRWNLCVILIYALSVLVLSSCLNCVLLHSVKKPEGQFDISFVNHAFNTLTMSNFTSLWLPYISIIWKENEIKAIRIFIKDMMGDRNWVINNICGEYESCMFLN